MPGVASVQTSRRSREGYERNPILKWAPFAKIHQKWAYLIFGVSSKPEYILKKRESWHEVLEIRDYWAIGGKLTHLIGLK